MTFDAHANGFVRGEGGGLVVLKQLDRALADGDPVRSVIRGSAVINDCGGDTLTAPDQGAQAEVVRRALRNAGPTTLLSLESPLRQTAQEAGPDDGSPPWQRRPAARLEARLRHLGENDPATPALAVERPDTARRDERELLVALRTREPELAAPLPDRLRGPVGNCWFRGLRTLVRGLEAERRAARGGHRRRGNVERAEELSARHLGQACKWGAPAPLGRALALRATLTGAAAAPSLLRDATEVLEAFTDLHGRAVVLLRLAETVAPYRAHEAEQALRTAYDLAVACNAAWVAAALKDAGLFDRGRPEGRTVPFQLRLRLRLRPRPGRSAPRSARRGRSARQRRVR
ncbi:beta-ketoacyl synthase N-terminal-like domain-containing protein [Streptomyces lasiicapitis]|uniref:beta-ketoacyl synthase N-terminal-like domain-containing protein n=1 Tax=Streptomyces lasiicapitis TaxID=1923961 RepID=UPI00331E7332